LARFKLQYAIYKKGAKPKWRDSNSFLKNFCIWLKIGIGGQTGRYNYNYSESGAKDINGSTYSIYDIGNVLRRSGGRDPRIHIGDKVSPSSPTPNDFKLEQEVTNATASTSPAEGAGVTVSGNQSLFDVSATFSLSETKNITEIGLSTLYMYNNTDEARFLLLRDVVSPPVEFPADTPMIVRYRLIMEA
jgi:hypothetical protein